LAYCLFVPLIYLSYLKSKISYIYLIFIILYLYLFSIYYFAGNGETTGRGEYGKYPFRKILSFVELFFTEWKSRR